MPAKVHAMHLTREAILPGMLALYRRVYVKAIFGTLPPEQKATVRRLRKIKVKGAA